MPHRFRTFHAGALALAAAMLAFAVWSVIHAQQPRLQPDPSVAPPRAVFPQSVAGIGIVEPSSESISVATELGGVVAKLFVKAGDSVAEGQPLWAIDDRSYRAVLDEARAAVEGERDAIAVIDRRIPLQRSLVDAAEAAVAEAAVERDRSALDRSRYEKLGAEAIASQQQLETAAAKNSKATAALDGARAALVSARVELDVLAASRSEAEAKLAGAEAAQARAEIDLDRTVVRAPIAGEILRVNIHRGEYAQPGAGAEPLLVMGAVHPLHVRVAIDETDSWRVRPGARAIAQLRGNPALSTPLTFVRFEPQVVPKRTLADPADEHVDMRVLQVIYSFDPASLPAYPGQEVDVFIDAPRQP